MGITAVIRTCAAKSDFLIPGSEERGHKEVYRLRMRRVS